jgi:hypothetical protein
MVSRKHSQIRMMGGQFVVEDLGSSNGTHVNNLRVQAQPLNHGDVIQCGTLVMRFDGASPQTPPPKRGGTMVLQPDDAPPLPGGYAPAMQTGFGQPGPGWPPAPPPYGGPTGVSGGAPFGGPPQMPSGGSIPPTSNPGFGRAHVGGFGGSVGSQSNAGPYDGPPAMPSGPPTQLPYDGPPGMPGGGVAAPSSYGGPPAMPAAMPGVRDPSMFGRNAPLGAPPAGSAAPRPQSGAVEPNVLVELGLEFDPAKSETEIKGLRSQLDKMSANYEREVADGKRVRSDAAALRERVEELRAQVKDREDQVSAHDRVADELRDELQQTRNELNRSRAELGDLAENLAARDRQSARALEETAKLREDMEDKNRQLMELSRTKDEGWTKLNDQLTEIEHLREVINEQERMLEERRVGLISQEEVIKELRGEREKAIKATAQLRAERDEAAGQASRNAAQINGLEEENRRLGRLMVESQTDAGRGGAQPDQLMKMTGDIRELRVELKKVEADRERLEQQHKVVESDRERLENRLAQIEVELQEAVHGRMAAESARNVAQDALAKAEVARHKAAEEVLIASKARDAASTGSDDARRELDRLRKKVAEIDKAAQLPAIPALDLKQLGAEREAAERKLKDANDRAAAAERSQKSLVAELDAARTDAAKARAEAARIKAAAEAHAEAVLDGGTTTVSPTDLAAVAQEVYEAINDILSEIRNNVLLVQGELPSLGADGPTLHAVSQAVEALVDNAETAKGALRGLRDLANAGG